MLLQQKTQTKTTKKQDRITCSKLHLALHGEPVHNTKENRRGFLKQLSQVVQSPQKIF